MTGPKLAAPPETLDDDPRITQLMTPRILGITPDSPLSTALRLMADAGVRQLPVLDRGRCMGVVTEGELAGFVAAGPGSFAARLAIRVEELTRPTQPLPTTARAAGRTRAECTDAVLVSDKGCLVGLVTATDLVRSLAGAAPVRLRQGARS